MSSVCSAVQTIKSGNGSQTQFSFDFPYVFKSEIHVYFWNVTTKEYDEVLTTDATYPWQVTEANPTTVEFTGTAPPTPADATANVKIRRITNIDNIKALFNPGSAIRSDDLNNNFEQLRFAIQESLCPDVTEAEVVAYLQNYYWNNFEDTVASTDTWDSSDTKIATTAAMDARFQDELSETITSTETWANDDNTIATTAAIDDQIDNAITNDIGADTTGITVTDDGDGTITLGIAANSVDLDRIKDADIVASGETWANNDTTIATTAKIDDVIDDAITNDILIDTTGLTKSTSNGQTTLGIGTGSVDLDRIKDEDIVTSSESNPNNDTTIATTAKIDDMIDDAITNDILIDSTGLTKNSSGGQTTLGIGSGTVDLDRIKSDDIVETSAYSSTWTDEDDKIVTAGALAARHDLVVNTDTSPPSTNQIGKQWLSIAPGNQVHKIYDGTGWRTVAVGQPYSPLTTTIVRYVDATNGSDASDVTGFLPQAPLRSIGRALELVNASGSGDGTLIKVDPGVYQETLPLRIKKNNVSIVGTSMRSCFIHPTVATENNDMFEVDSGSYIANFTMCGLKVPTANQSSRNNSLDNDATYGLPSNQPFAVRFRTDVAPVILKSPYIQNCSHFSDAHFDNVNFDPNTFPSTDSQTYSAVAGDQSSAPCGGGLLVDGSAVSSSSPIRSMVVDAFTQITLDGPGILVTNNGYAQLVSFFGTFAHYHAKAKNGGQINLSNCVSDFGRYGLIADGKSPSAIATATASAASSGATTITIGAITTDSSFHGTVNRPLDHMMVTIDGVDYGVVSSTANGAGWDIVLTSGLTSNITNTTVSFALRSYISTGGHTFEFVGVGTDYSDHPDFGGVPIEANQVIQLNGGKVWQSSTDHVGKFKAGDVLVVDQVSETVDLKDTTVTGNLAVTGTVDGRDVATDGTKLDGIESGATADQTAAEIRTLVEAATDSNVFTDADYTKLNGIETGATADQTAAEIKTAYESNSDTNAFTDAEQTKLSGIETGAEVNVNADWNATSGDAQILNKPTIPAAYTDSDVDAHLNTSTAATNEVLSWTGTEYDWVAQSGGGGGGASAINDLSDAVTNSSGGTIGLGTDALANDDGTSNNNTAVGFEALKATTSGYANTAVGHQAGLSITSGYINDIFGNSAGDAITTGNRNTLIGHAAGGRITTGTRNVCVGSIAGNLLTTGFRNVYLGDGAASNASTGSYNVVIGQSAGGSNHTTGSTNIFIGRNAFASSAGVNGEICIGSTLYSSLRIPHIQDGASDGDVLTYDSTNDKLVLSAASSSGGASAINDLSDAVTYDSGSSIGLGTGALANDDATANMNVAVGLNAFNVLTSGNNSVAIGWEAGKAQTTGVQNTFVGSRAGTKVTTGPHNVFIGWEAGYECTTGDKNIGVGRQALDAITTGQFNIAMGYQAMGSSGTAVSSSTALGYQALKSVTGNNNTALGYLAGNTTTSGTNVTCIGYDAEASSATASNEVTLGNASVATLRCNTQTISSLSDGRDKTEVEDLPVGLDFIDTLRPVKFKWATRDGNGKDGSYEAGFIAQDLQSAQSTSNADYLNMVMDSNPDRLEARYGQLIPVLVQAIKDLKTEIETLKANA